MRLSASGDIPSGLMDTFELTMSRGIDLGELDSQSWVYDLEFPKLSHAIELAGGVNASDHDLMVVAFAVSGKFGTRVTRCLSGRIPALLRNGRPCAMWRGAP